MKISIRRKIVATFGIFFVVGASIWFLNYNKQRVLEQKLRILEKKDNLFNTILEARRYEKNYFLYLELQNLREALSYVEKAELKFSQIIQEYGRYTLGRNLPEKLEELRRYRDSLAALSGFYESGALNLDEKLMADAPERQEEVRRLGKQITSDMEQMLAQERRYVNELVGEARVYHLVALGGILLLCIFTALFLVFNVIRPLKSIEDAIHKIAGGDYENIPALSTGDEFESLVSSLNNMINELNRRSEQLIQTKKMASLGTLTSGVAHELNNPLNNISTSVQILLEELQEGDREFHKELLKETESQVERARDIVKALLEFSRERSFSLKRTHFKELVDQTIKLIKGEVPANVEIRVDIPDEIREEMDPRRIQQVLINLVMNGVQAMQDGGILNIRADEKKEEEGFCFEVQDSGKGIPEQDLAKIFDPFFTTKEVGKGFGLGLSVTHGIVEQHGGRIEVESDLGRGTTFKVFLPAQEASASSQTHKLDETGPPEGAERE